MGLFGRHGDGEEELAKAIAKRGVPAEATNASLREPGRGPRRSRVHNPNQAFEGRAVVAVPIEQARVGLGGEP